ncbi:hypothetical protein EIP86_009073 [Pleurotus ostreatoroseus]|nr:hypothetical protein EIP86_009073 [Pleurotus ostreatoroseus]
MARRRRLLLKCTPTRVDSVLQVLRALCRPDIVALTSDQQADRMRAIKLLTEAEEKLHAAGLPVTDAASSTSRAEADGNQLNQSTDYDSDESMPALETDSESEVSDGNGTQ